MKTFLLYIYTITGILLLSNCKTSDKNTEQTIFQGKVERDQISVVTKIPGRIKETLIHEGEQVKEGQTLFVLKLYHQNPFLNI